jgi:hypothetical protein
MNMRKPASLFHLPQTLQIEKFIPEVSNGSALLATVVEIKKRRYV